jgi:hypothetical protein
MTWICHIWIISLIILALMLRILFCALIKRDEEKEFQEREKELHLRHLAKMNQGRVKS